MLSSGPKLLESWKICNQEATVNTGLSCPIICCRTVAKMASAAIKEKKMPRSDLALMTSGILTTILCLTDFNRSRKRAFRAAAVYQQHTANTQATINSTLMLPPSFSNWFTSDNNYNRKYLGKKYTLP